ncbi:MAG: diacylglycerol kinase family protein [Polyangiaceae bacterium]
MSTHVVINRSARHLRTDTALYRSILASASGATVHETKRIDALDGVARVIAKSAGKTVVLCGGDGSYMAGVTALAKAFGEDPLPKIALAPGGTVSTVARNWGMKGSLESYAKRILRAAIEDDARTKTRPTMRVRDAADGERIGFIFGAGLVAQFFDVYDASSEQGYVGAAKIVARIFGGSFVGSALAKKVLTPVPCELEIDGIRSPARAFSLIVASVVKNLGLHMHVLHRAAEDHARVHLVASPLGPFLLGPQLPLVIAGKSLRGKNHVDTLTKKFRVTFEQENAYVLDGDMMRARWVEVSAGPQIETIDLSDE